MIGKAKKRINALSKIMTAPSKTPITKSKITFNHEYDNVPPLLNHDYESDLDDEEDPPTKNVPPPPTDTNAPPKPPLSPRPPTIPVSQPPGLPPKPKVIPGPPKDNNKVKISLQNRIGQRIDEKMLGKY